MFQEVHELDSVMCFNQSRLCDFAREEWDEKRRIMDEDWFNLGKATVNYERSGGVVSSNESFQFNVNKSSENSCVYNSYNREYHN